MFYNSGMDLVQKLGLLGCETRHEPAGDEVPAVSSRLPPELVDCITHVISPHNRQMPVLKAMTTTVCTRDCNYCGMRCGRDTRRVTFSPDEMADGFFRIYRAGLVEGIFLSSGILGDGVRAQDQIIATAEIIRLKLGFQGYVHLKVMPGAEYDQVVRTMQLANRVSVNLEAPNPGRLERLAPHKGFADELLQRLRWVEQIREDQGGRGPSSTTQFVVGPAGESDLELLQTTQHLHQHLGLKRAYFSRFDPIPDTPLENAPPTPVVRQHRLFQSSFLLRDYHFEVEELPFGPDGNLPLNQDPKLLWARENLFWRPVELNRAERQELLRVPGIGPKGADRVLQERRRGILRNLAELRKIGVLADRAAPFITLDGARPPLQLPLW
jgi:predicted DNA-binding helix-hairpin-helix protein